VSDGAAVTWAELLAETSAALGDPREARWICEQAGGFSAAELAASRDEAVRTAMAAAVHAMVRRRCAGEPLQYVLGSWSFRRLDLLVDRRVLIPRPETEVVAGVAIDLVRAAGPGATAVDLGTGSGAIALAMAATRTDLRITATDQSIEALAVARDNARRHGLGEDRIIFRPGSWWQAVDADERFDLIVSNPPYIAESDPHLAQGDLRFEPRAALASGPDGLDALRAIASGAPNHLAAGGWLIVEHGWNQGEAVRALFGAAGLHDAHTLRDLAGQERVTLGRAPEIALQPRVV